MEKNTLSILVDNESGVLTRVSGLISRRGFNIDSLAVGETEQSGVSRITIIVICDARALDQIVFQLKKLVCVRQIEILAPSEAVCRELLLVKVRTCSDTRSDIVQIANIFRARVIDMSPGSITLEITGESDKTSALIELLAEYGVMEICRTGAVAIGRGAKTIYDMA